MREFRLTLAVLNATDESNLSASIKTLGDRELGWITLSETRSLFSEFDDDTAFGEMDPAAGRVSRHLRRGLNIDLT
jgi:hypothetical protein